MVEYKIGESIVTVIVGIDGQPPPIDILGDVESLVNDRVNSQAEFEVGRDSVTLTVVENPSREQKEVLGSETLYIMKFDISLGLDELEPELVHAAHNTAVSKLNQLSFNITGTATVWDNKMQA
jgi:hypothetical protein